MACMVVSLIAYEHLELGGWVSVCHGCYISANVVTHGGLQVVRRVVDHVTQQMRPADNTAISILPKATPRGACGSVCTHNVLHRMVGGTARLLPVVHDHVY